MATKQKHPTEEARRRIQRGKDTLTNAVQVHPGTHGGGRRAGQGVRRTQRPQGRPDGAEDGRAGPAVLAECELPTRSQPTPGNQEGARVTTLAVPRVWQHTQLCEGERPYAMSRLAVAESNRRRAPVLLTAAERSAT